MVTSTTKSSTPRLSEVARHVVIPSGIVSTGWPAVEAKCAEWGDRFDRWQQGLGRAILGKRADGKYAATIGGVTLSIPRQVAKTFLVGRIIFALCILTSGVKVLWTAHRSRTSDETFRKLKGLARRKGVAPYVLAVRSANGQQEIEFRNGSRILFGAREQGFGLGFDEVDVIVFDEAQRLTQKALDDMVPASNQSRQPSGALLFYMGTPPRPTDPGDVFIERRAEALASKRSVKGVDFGPVVESGDEVFIECSADANVGKPDGPSLDNPDQWRKANPSYPTRTPHESMLRMRKNLKSDDAWRREALGIWDDLARTGTRLITADQWSSTGVPEAPQGVKSFGIAFSLDGTRVAVGGARKHVDGVHVELVDAHTGPVDAGVARLADWLAERWRDTATIVISGKAGASVLAQELKTRGVPARVVHVASSADYFTSCAMLLDSVREGSVTHLATEGQQALDDSVSVCDRKSRGTSGAWGWVATTTTGDETPTEAIGLALWGARTSKRNPGAGRGRSSGHRRGVVLS